MKTLAVRPKLFAFTQSLTVGEFFDLTPKLATPIRKRLQELHLEPADQLFFVTFPDTLNFLVLLSEDAPETTIVLPILVRLVELSPRFVLHILRDTDDLKLLQAMLEESEFTEELIDSDLPLVLIFDEEWNFQAQWGPHPQEAEAYLDRWFEEHPEYESLAEEDSVESQRQYAALLESLTHEMRVWYNSGLNQACVKELRGLLESVTIEEDGEDREVE